MNGTEPIYTYLAADQGSMDRDGGTLLSYLMGLGAIVAVLALIMVAGKMIHANFTGDPWIAARGMAELPYILLAVGMMLVAAPMMVALLSGAPSFSGQDPVGDAMEERELSQPSNLFEQAQQSFCDRFSTSFCD